MATFCVPVVEKNYVRTTKTVEIVNICHFFAEQRLHFLWRELITLCGKKLFYNPFTGW